MELESYKWESEDEIYTGPQLVDKDSECFGDKFKHSCETCIKAKVKCSSLKPHCQRCMEKQLICTYLPESKRGRKRRNASSKSNKGSKDVKPFLFSVDPLGDALLSRGKRPNLGLAWWLFDTFIGVVSNRNRNSSPTLPMYLMKFVNVFRTHAFAIGSSQVHIIDSMLERENLDLRKFMRLDSEPKKTQEYLAAKEEVIAWFNDPNQIYRDRGDLIVGGMFANKSVFKSMWKQEDSHLPRIVFYESVTDLVGGSARKFKVNSNAAFRTVFGLSEEDIEHRLKDDAIGFLPHGASLLALIADEGEVVSYLKSHCLKMQQYGRSVTKTFHFSNTTVDKPWDFVRGFSSSASPLVLEKPDIIAIRANIRKTPYGTETTSCLFFMTVVSKTVTDGTFFHEAISFQFKSMEDISHLCLDNRYLCGEEGEEKVESPNDILDTLVDYF